MSLPRRRKNVTPLHNKARLLQEREEKLRRQKEELEKLLREAPRIKEEQEKRRRNAVIAEHRRHGRGFDAPSIHDKRYTLNANVMTVGNRSLRRERREAKKRTLWLCLLFLGVLALLLFRMIG